MNLVGREQLQLIFGFDPDEDLVGIMMTQYLGSMWPITDDMRVAMYQAID